MLKPSNTQQSDNRLDIPRYQVFRKHSTSVDRDRWFAQLEEMGLAKMMYKHFLPNPPSLTPEGCYSGTLTLSIPALSHPVPTLVICR